MSNDAPGWTLVPAEWTELTDALRDQVKTRALEALTIQGPRAAQARLVEFYDVDGEYAGESFASLQPIEPDTITATDLHATQLLSVRIGAGVTRRLLDDGPSRTEVLTALRAVDDSDLLVAGPETLLAMETFYLAVKTKMSSPDTKNPNPWVTTSKLCARKRPELFPVRDRVVCGYLGLSGRHHDYRVDWQAFRFLIGDRDVIAAIDALRDAVTAAAGPRRVRLDLARLRLLDAALWTYAVWHVPGSKDDITD